ncbi:hypothetical protein BN938_1808 [Mucinivorans hirudinis]|uniref:Uncharacterized protein n=1 Tax=Mucinivorans hirudinis TaxID=1433126 RepID=A0A060RD47_9BACT|nr:hypothetical protein BN938_1808 [Mucinivorans hirudinis]
MNEELRITTDEGDVVYIHLCPNKTPIAYQRKKKELVECSGMTEAEAENCLLRPIPIELFYSYDQGLFGIEAECLASCEVYNPYTGEEIPNDNLP